MGLSQEFIFEENTKRRFQENLREIQMRNEQDEQASLKEKNISIQNYLRRFLEYNTP